MVCTVRTPAATEAVCMDVFSLAVIFLWYAVHKFWIMTYYGRKLVWSNPASSIPTYLELYSICVLSLNKSMRWWQFFILFVETRMAVFLHSLSEDENRSGAVLHTSFWVWDSEMSGTIIGWSHSESLGTHPLIIYYPSNVGRLIYSGTPEMLRKEERS